MPFKKDPELTICIKVNFANGENFCFNGEASILYDLLKVQLTPISNCSWNKYLYFVK